MATPVHPLAAQLAALPFSERTEIARQAGVIPACCPGCGCYFNSPHCPDTYDPFRPELHTCVCPDNPDNEIE